MGWVLIIIGLVLIGVVIYVMMFAFKKDEGTTQERIHHLREDKYSTDMTRQRARKEAKAATARAEAIAAINVEASQLGVIETAEADAVVADSLRQTEVARNVTEQRELESKRGLLQIADGERVDVDTYLQVEQKKRLNAADLDNELAKMREAVRLAIIAKHLSEHQKISLVNEQLDGLYRQIDEIENLKDLSDKAKQRMIADREEIVVTLQEDRRARQRGLLEANNGGDLRGDDANTNDGGNAEPAMEGDTE